MKKKLLILLFVLVLTLSAFSMTANAAVEIGAIGIENLLAPLAGNKPDYSINYINGNLVSKQVIDGYSPINGICWFELVETGVGSEPKEREMTKYESFELGKKYRVRIFVMPNNSNTVFKDSVTARIYEMSSDTEGMTYKTGTVTTPTGNTNSQYKVVSATYECTKKSIVAVEITGLKTPKLGEYPDNDCNVLTQGVYANGMVTWTHKLGEDNYESWDYDKAFEAGETYKYSLWLRTDFVNGYRFRTDIKGENIADIMVNGIVIDEENIRDTWDVDYVRCIEYEYYVPFKSISNIDVVGVSVPIAGEEPDYDAAPTTSGYDITDMHWIDITLRTEYISQGKTYVEAAALAKMKKGDGKTFIAGHEYMVNFEATPQTDFEINYDPYDEDILDFAATVNGKDATEYSGRKGEAANFSYTFGTPELQIIEKISVKGIDEPKTGAVPDYKAECETVGADITELYWYDRTTKEKLYEGDGKKFVAGHEYTACVTVTAQESYALIDDGDVLTVDTFINGFPAGSSSAYKGSRSIHFVADFEHLCNNVTVKKVDATCTKKGYTGDVICSVCNKVFKKGAEVNVKAHSIVTVKGKAATYVSDGLTDGKKCSVCSKITVAQKAVARKKLSKVTGLKTKAVKLASGTKTTLTLTWAKVEGAQSYEVQQYSGGTWKTVGTTASDSLTVKKLKAKKTYKFRVRAVAGKYYGDYSSSYSAKTVPLKTTLKVTAGKKKLTASWSAVSNITKYEIQYSTSKKFKKKTTKTTKSRKLTVKKLKKGKKYYVRVRAYKTVNGQKVYSSWSSVKSVKIK